MPRWGCKSNCIGLIEDDIKVIQTVKEFCTTSLFFCKRCNQPAYISILEEVLSATPNIPTLPSVTWIITGTYVLVVNCQTNESEVYKFYDFLDLVLKVKESRNGRNNA